MDKKTLIIALSIVIITSSIVISTIFSLQKKNTISQPKNLIEQQDNLRNKNLSNTSTNTNSQDQVVESSGFNCTQVYNDLFQKAQRDFQKCGVFTENISCDDSQSQKPKTQKNLVIILDSSGSMAGQIGGRSKIDIAKEAAWKFLDDMNGSDVKLSILVYGHKGSNSASHKQLSCSSIDEIYYFGELDSQLAKDKINQFNPTGWTPIADSLEKASDILIKNSQQGDDNSILLISDGKETCDGDPVAKAAELKNSDGIITNVIAFDVEGDVKNQLKNISQSGGGTFYSANSMQEMFDALAQEREKYWQKYACESEQWSEWLDKSLDLNFIGHTCASDLHWEQWDMIDMGTNMMNDLPVECKASVADAYKTLRYQIIRESLIKNYIQTYFKVNSTMKGQEIWKSDTDNNELINNLKSDWNHQWDADLSWDWVNKEVKKASEL